MNDTTQTMGTYNLGAKWALLPKDHPKVIKRLCKELNNRSNGFYHNGERYTLARYRKGNLEVSFCLEGWTVVDASGHFDDGYGNGICASRTLCGW